MIPGGFSPTDRPVTDHELRTDDPHETTRLRRRSAASTWITLAVIVLLVIGAIVLLSYLPE